MLIWLLLQVAATDDPPVPPVEPIVTLREVVVDAIRNCVRREGEITVCSRDRGFAEGHRLPKIKKPEPPADAPGIQVQVTGGLPDTPDPTAPR